MSFEQAMQVADAVLFEGYLLYPYRASAPKNQVRWQFGVLAPPGADPSETSIAQTECLVDPRDAAPALQVRARFLQVQARSGELPWEEGVVRETDAAMELMPGATTYFPFEIAGGVDGPRRRWPLTGVLSIMVERLPGPYGTIKVRI